MKQLIFVFQLLLITTGVSFSQVTTGTDPVKLIRAGNKTTFGSSQSAVADYLVSKGINAGEGDTYRRSAFKLVINSSGKVIESEKFYGGISTELDSKIAAAFLEMPNWKTSVSENERSVVYVVVTLQKQTVTTELY